MTQRYLSQTQPSRSFAAWIAGLALATAFLPFSSATAQEAADAAAEEAEDVLVLGVPAQQPAFSDDDIERWVFQNQQNAATARKEMAAMLKLKAEDIGRVS